MSNGKNDEVSKFEVDCGPPDGFKVQIDVSARDVASLICSGFEGGVSYWCRIMDYREPKVVRPVIDEDEVFKHNDYPLLDGGAVICRVFDEGTDKKYAPLVLDRDAVQRGLTLMAEKYPRHWGDFLSTNYDACTGDVFLQLCLLGEVVYG